MTTHSRKPPVLFRGSMEGRSEVRNPRQRGHDSNVASQRSPGSRGCRAAVVVARVRDGAALQPCGEAMALASRSPDIVNRKTRKEFGTLLQ